VRGIFKDETLDLSFKKCIDISELAPKLVNAGLEINQPENIGPIFRCFGCIELEEGWGLRQPPETEEQIKRNCSSRTSLINKKRRAKIRRRKNSINL